jgi:hypothetical protein
MLSSPASASDFVTSISREADSYPSSMAKALSNPDTRKKALKAIANMPNLTGNDSPNLEASTRDISAQSEWLAQTEKTFAQKAALPDAEFKAWWTQVSEEGKSRPFAAMSLPTLETMRERYRADSVNRSMLAAGLTVMQSGADQIGTYLDPTTGHPFTYVETAAGFELRSTFQYKKKPVTMSFSSPAPQP